MAASSNSAVVLAGMVIFWYGSSMLSATTSKSLLLGVEGQRVNAFEMTLLQMWISAGCAGILSVASHGGGVSQLRPKSPHAALRTLSLGAVFAVAFVSLNLAYSLMSASLANTLRALEPLSSLLLAALTTDESVTDWRLLLSVAAIVTGACLASYGNSEATPLGLFYCTIANLAFAYRTIQYKAIRAEFSVDHATLFFQTCVVSGALLVPVLVVLQPWRELLAQSWMVLHCTPEFFSTLMVNGVTFFLYLQLSFATLSYITVVTHSILNSFRRPAVIVFDVLIFRTKLSDVNAAGVTLACAGVTAFSMIKAHIAAQPASKARQSPLAHDKALLAPAAPPASASAPGSPKAAKYH
jgi:drug/metabolite transporter (DMT)-like permease